VRARKYRMVQPIAEAGTTEPNTRSTDISCRAMREPA